MYRHCILCYRVNQTAVAIQVSCRMFWKGHFGRKLIARFSPCCYCVYNTKGLFYLTCVGVYDWCLWFRKFIVQLESFGCGKMPNSSGEDNCRMFWTENTLFTKFVSAAILICSQSLGIFFCGTWAFCLINRHAKFTLEE